MATSLAVPRRLFWFSSKSYAAEMEPLVRALLPTTLHHPITIILFSTNAPLFLVISTDSILDDATKSAFVFGIRFVFERRLKG